MNQVGAHILVSGLVQGVGYRYFCHKRAVQLGLKGWVRNQPDGSVAVYAEGDRSQIEALIDLLRVGPINASVSNCDICWETFTGQYSTFSITQ